MDPNEGQEELEEVQAELKKKEAEVFFLQLFQVGYELSFGLLSVTLEVAGAISAIHCWYVPC